MKNSLKLLQFYLVESFNEVRNNLNIFGVYILGLAAVSIVSNVTVFFYVKDNRTLEVVAKILFSLISLLILSKILYVMKVRISGQGEYLKVMGNFIWYNIMYSVLVGLGLLIFFLPSLAIAFLVQSKAAFIWTLLFLIPFIYFMIFYSLMPFIAVFEEDRSLNFFAESKRFTKNNLSLVVINHIFSLLPHLFFLVQNFLKPPALRFSFICATSIPEAVFSLVVTITTVKIYYYMLNKQEF